MSPVVHEVTLRVWPFEPASGAIATVLAILSGLFYAAGHNEIGSFGVTMCQYGSSFCNNPILVLTGAGLAALWGSFVSVR